MKSFLVVYDLWGKVVIDNAKDVDDAIEQARDMINDGKLGTVKEINIDPNDVKDISADEE